MESGLEVWSIEFKVVSDRGRGMLRGCKQERGAGIGNDCQSPDCC